MTLALDRAETLYWSTAALLVLLFVILAGVQLFDKRMIADESIWAKPLKFNVALAVHFATLALATGLLGPPYRTDAILYAVALAAVASTAFEMSYMVVQASRQQASHFNLSSPFHAAMYVLMAIGAVFITCAAAAVGIAIWIDDAARITAPLRAAIALGLIGGALLTLIVAFRMGGALNHHVGVEAAGAARVPLAGWSRTVGDLRVPHFFATHTMQAVPIAGLIVERLSSGPTGVAAIWVFACAWSALTLFLFTRALAGEPVPI